MKMSLFGKLKKMGPPAPPRRTEITDDLRWKRHAGWQEDEEDEGDMYEVPPCERPAVNVPLRQVEENLYIERNSSVSVHTPAPRPTVKTQRSQQHAKEFTTKKPPEVDRNEKPGRKKMASLPAGFFMTTMEEDVYLEPNEGPVNYLINSNHFDELFNGTHTWSSVQFSYRHQKLCLLIFQGEDDDLYLEPAAACPPDPPDPMRMFSPTKISPSPSLIMKPPVPRGNSNSFLPSLTDLKTSFSHLTSSCNGRVSVPHFDARPVTSKLPSMTAGFKSPLSNTLKASMPRHANPHMLDTKNARGRIASQSENEDKEWFAGDCNRKSAEDLLLGANKDGTFLIRHSSAQNAQQPFTLAVLYQQRVYNIPVRFLEEMQGFALGKEGKKSEEVFTSLDEMVMHHKKKQLYLIDSKSQAKHAVYLAHAARC
ncbi:lymphocyte cytosolic protein 2 [Stigmatopora argus]